MRNEIYCVTPDNDAIVTVIENDCDSLTFQCGCAYEWFAHARHIKRGLYQNSSATVRRHVTINNFLSTMLLCHVVCSHCSYTSSKYSSQFTVCRCLVLSPSEKSIALHQRVQLPLPFSLVANLMALAKTRVSMSRHRACCSHSRSLRIL